MPKLKPWYQVVTPREDLRENRPLDASEFAVHLDHIRLGRAHPDYIEPRRFFDRTFFTQSLLDLSSQVLRRLSGVTVETSAIFTGLRCKKRTWLHASAVRDLCIQAIDVRKMRRTYIAWLSQAIDEYFKTVGSSSWPMGLHFK